MNPIVDFSSVFFGELCIEHLREFYPSGEAGYRDAVGVFCMFDGITEQFDES